jgi:RNA polymerase sigma-32 factor
VSPRREKASSPAKGGTAVSVRAPASLPWLPAPPAERGLDARDALARYMAELRHHAPISREEEHALALRWREHGDLEAARRLVLSNLRLVVKIALEYRRSWTQLLDLVQEGNVGLLQAVQRFDPAQGVKLASYAAYWIRAYILKYLIDNIRMVRLGSSRAERKLFFRLNREKRELERQGFEVEPRLLAERLDVSERDVEQMEQRLAEGDLSLDAPLHAGEPDRTFGDTVGGGGASVEERVGDEELRSVFLAHVKEFAEGLDERERRIVAARILAEEPLTLQEIGDEFGVTRERVRQLEARLVARLREYLKQNVVDFEYYAPED